MVPEGLLGPPAHEAGQSTQCRFALCGLVGAHTATTHSRSSSMSRIDKVLYSGCPPNARCRDDIDVAISIV